MPRLCICLQMRSSTILVAPSKMALHRQLVQPFRNLILGFVLFFNTMILIIKTNKKIAEVVSEMLAMECSFPPFARVCFLAKNDRGVVLAHFINQASKKTGLT